MKFTTPILTGKKDYYVVSVYVNGVQHKKRVSKKLSASDQKKYADALVETWVEMLEKGISPFTNEGKKKFTNLNKEITLSEAIAEYVCEASASQNTINAYRYKLQHLLSDLGDIPLLSITTANLEKVLKNKIKDSVYTQSTVEHAKKSYRAFFNWAVKNKHIEQSPMSEVAKNIKSDKDGVERNNPIQSNDFKIIMECIKSLENQSLYYFSCFVYHACLRPNEVRNLRIGDVDLVNNIINVKASVSKNNTRDFVPIYPALLKIIKLMDIGDGNKADYLFSSRCRKNLSPFNGLKYVGDDFFGDWFRAILKELNLYEGKGYSLYSMKHTSNVDKINGVKPWKPSELMLLNRHSDIQQTLVYLAKISKVTPIDHLESREI